MERTLSSRQLMALSFVSMLSPFLRLLPSSVAEQAGSAAWISAALVIIPAALLSWAVIGLLDYFPKGTGFGEAILRSLGAFPGSVFLALWSLWLVFHSGFILRSGADRFIATIYPGSKPTLFIVITVVLCTIAALGQVKSIARAAQIFRPLLLFVIAVVLIFTIQEVEPTFLLPVMESQTSEILRGVPLAAEPVSVVLVNAAFLTKFLQPTEQHRRHWWWLVGVCLLGMLFCVISIGSLGKTMTTALPYPFFVMARDLSIVSGVERIEALVVALWLLPDFVLVTVELMIAADNILMICGRLSDAKWRKGWVLFGAGLATLTAFLIAPNSQSLLEWSDKLIPAMHLGWAYLILPFVLLVCTIRKKF